MSPLLRLAGLAVAAALAMSACGGSEAATTVTGIPAAEVSVPPAVGGLELVPEDAGTTALNDATKELSEQESDSYVNDSIVYALREGEELKGVLQISRLVGDARPDDREWRREVIAQIGSGSTKPARMGEYLVYERPGNSQVIYVWFAGNHMWVLVVRQDETVKGEGAVDAEALLNEVVAITPASGV